MEIRVNCNNLIILNNFNDLKQIRLGVLSYNLNEAMLTGDVKVSGEYFKEEMQEMGFEEIVPFTVVFRNNKIKIEKVYLDNESYNVKENQGVDVNFELVVNYSLIEEAEIFDNNMNDENNKQEEIIEVPVAINEEIQMVDSTAVDEMLEEANKITKEYDELLTKILNTRNEQELQIDDNKETEIEELDSKPNYSNVNIIKNNNKVSFKNQTTTNNKITVYYVNKENELETIAKEKRISIGDIYKLNSDFEKTRRIIINE